jgi:hypothetical protein
LFRAIALIYTGGNPVFGILTEFRSLINSENFWHSNAYRYCCRYCFGTVDRHE